MERRFRMKLSRKGEYACLALLQLTEAYGKNLVTIAEISDSKKIPKKYLEQILLQLKGAGYVKSARGINGGYKLAKSPDKISLAEIVRLIDGPIAPVESASVFFYESTPVEQSDKLLGVLKEVRQMVSDKLESTMFSDLI